MFPDHLSRSFHTHAHVRTVFALNDQQTFKSNNYDVVRTWYIGMLYVVPECSTLENKIEHLPPFPSGQPKHLTVCTYA